MKNHSFSESFIYVQITAKFVVGETSCAKWPRQQNNVVFVFAVDSFVFSPSLIKPLKANIFIVGVVFV